MIIRETSNLERVVLDALKCACREDRLDIADFMLAALEKLDQERSGAQAGERPVTKAYREIDAPFRRRGRK
ncbi:MAG: hypothetical protein J0I99_19870 [Devosia sp.]|uniref:hypothetical protein n=1 Tax=Devosia sp. TaxID=1871048 RepID=UPI001ACD656A|nr:hypothetical protein [Devosia sp.]MBN9318004.1 hypothetical protein [Devosia sp.]